MNILVAMRDISQPLRASRVVICVAVIKIEGLEQTR